ncbi:MAG: winged helix-turn-helix domain-containing protein [Chloroflexia bacterium]
MRTQTDNEKELLQNPYFRLPVTFDPDKFYGSERWVRHILEAASATPTHDLELFGLPGMAKTTLLRYCADPNGAFMHHLEMLAGIYEKEPWRILPVLIEFRQLPPKMHPITFIYKRLCEEYAGYRERTLPKKLGLPDLLDAPPAYAGMAATDAATAIEAATRRIAGRGVRIVLLLDDFDIGFETMSEEETTRLRPWREYVAFILATERPLHEVNPAAIGSPFFQTLPLIRLGGLTPEEARQMLEIPANESGHPFPEADVEFILQQAGGHPYLLILGGRALWNSRERLGLLDSDEALPAEHAAVLRGRLQEDFGRTFQMYQARLATGEQDALRHLVKSELSEEDFVALASLEGKGLVKYEQGQGEQRGKYEAFSPLYASFIGNLPAATGPPEPNLNGMEAALYAYLRAHQDRICSFAELWREVWGRPEREESADHMRRRMQVTVSRLRKKLPAIGEDINSVRDQGYRFVARG